MYEPCSIKKKSLSSLLGFEIWVESDKAALPLEPLSASFVPHKLYSPSALASCNRLTLVLGFLFFVFFFYGIKTLEMFYITLCIFIFYVKKKKREKNTGEKELIVTVKIKDDLINFLTVSCWVPSGKTHGWGEDEQTVHTGSRVHVI